MNTDPRLLELERRLSADFFVALTDSSYGGNALDTRVESRRRAKIFMDALARSLAGEAKPAPLIGQSFDDPYPPYVYGAAAPVEAAPPCCLEFCNERLERCIREGCQAKAVAVETAREGPVAWRWRDSVGAASSWTDGGPNEVQRQYHTRMGDSIELAFAHPSTATEQNARASPELQAAVKTGLDYAVRNEALREALEALLKAINFRDACAAAGDYKYLTAAATKLAIAVRYADAALAAAAKQEKP